MSGVRVLVGTRKGAFILTTDGTRKQWDVSGPHFAGWEIYHLKGSPADPNRLYASQSSGWFGQVIQRSCDGGKTWREGSGLRGHGTGPKGQPGAGGLCLHTILLDPTNPRRMFVAISAAGAFRTDDGGTTWKPINRGLRSQYIPDPNAEVGHCVHRIALHRSRPNVLFMQKHWDVLRSDDAGDSWKEVSGNLPTDFGFAIDRRCSRWRCRRCDDPRRASASSADARARRQRGRGRCEGHGDAARRPRRSGDGLSDAAGHHS